MLLENSEKEDITTTILRMNNGSADMLLEGDVLLPRTRTAMKCLNPKYSCFWPKSSNGNVEIPFVLGDEYGRLDFFFFCRTRGKSLLKCPFHLTEPLLSSTVDDNDKNQILKAMKGFEDKTCIRFVRHRGERAYLSIESKFGCFSLMGRIGERQLVSLQRSGCLNNGIIQHELLHAMGFYHEHTRSDRDQYVKINWDNINSYYTRNFEKMDTDNLTPYDYSSVMQYGKTAFGKNGAETITPIPDPKVPIGQREGMSDKDILRINKLYDCRKYMG
ncbi:low choriolytic enzyme-like isoform 1-T1 [Fundulus diaphanus]